MSSLLEVQGNGRPIARKIIFGFFVDPIIHIENLYIFKIAL